MCTSIRSSSEKISSLGARLAFSVTKPRQSHRAPSSTSKHCTPRSRIDAGEGSLQRADAYDGGSIVKADIRLARRSKLFRQAEPSQFNILRSLAENSLIHLDIEYSLYRTLPKSCNLQIIHFDDRPHLASGSAALDRSPGLQSTSDRISSVIAGTKPICGEANPIGNTKFVKEIRNITPCMPATGRQLSPIPARRRTFLFEMRLSAPDRECACTPAAQTKSPGVCEHRLSTSALHPGLRVCHPGSAP